MSNNGTKFSCSWVLETACGLHIQFYPEIIHLKVFFLQLTKKRNFHETLHSF